MFRSIRTNLFAAFVGLISLFLVSVLVINVFFLDDIFIFGTRQAMEFTADELSEAMDSNGLSSEVVDEISFRTGLFIGVISENGVLEYNAGVLKQKLERPPELDEREDRDRREESAGLNNESSDLLLSFQTTPDQERIFYTEKAGGPRRSVILMERLNNGKILMLMKPLLPLKETSQLATVFILASGGVVLLIGAIGVFVMSGRLTAPILSMDRVARKMANLDFSESVQISSRDELGDLGASIQSMSENLHRSLNELKEANEKLQLEIERERELDRQRRRFISSVSHELRTPLSMIQGYADGLRHGVVEEPEGIREYCDVIVDETRKMSGLIRDMLDLSSYEAGAFTIVSAAFDLGELVRRDAQRVDTLLGQKGARVEVSGPEICRVIGDSGRIGQILSNYLNNAIKHGTAGKPVRITYGVQEDEAFLRVTNDGPPILGEDLQRIWDPFYKAGEGSVSRAAGFGLGLAIASAIAEAHGGRCLAENLENGVMFALVWPGTKRDIE